MDYVIAGLGYGAILAIAGFCLHELAMSRPAWVPRWTAGAGQALMFAALVIWGVTAAAFFSGLPDDTSDQVVAAVGVIATAGALLATVALALQRHPAAVRSAPGETRVQEVVRTQAVSATRLAEERSATVAQPAPATASEQESQSEEPAAEAPARTDKQWNEIWRQTWGSGSVPAEEPQETQGEPEEEAATVDAAVLETWGGSATENGQAPEPANDAVAERATPDEDSQKDAAAEAAAEQPGTGEDAAAGQGIEDQATPPERLANVEPEDIPVNGGAPPRETGVPEVDEVTEEAPAARSEPNA